MCVCACTCEWVCMCVSVHVCECIFICTYTCTHACMCASCSYTHTHTHTQTDMQNRQTSLPRQSVQGPRTYVHTYTQLCEIVRKAYYAKPRKDHIHTHTYIHAYIHTYTQLCEIIRKAYHSKARKHHPDKIIGGPSPEQVSYFNEIKKGYAVMVDCSLRRDYLEMKDHHK